MFRFSIEESSSLERWTIQGRLVGAFARELDSAWISSLENNPLLSRVVDLSGVVLIDRHGEQVLRRMLRHDAKFIASGVYTNQLLERLRSQGEFSLRDPHSVGTKRKYAPGRRSTR
jgi:hypothetical protein